MCVSMVQCGVAQADPAQSALFTALLVTEVMSSLCHAVKCCFVPLLKLKTEKRREGGVFNRR